MSTKTTFVHRAILAAFILFSSGIIKGEVSLREVLSPWPADCYGIWARKAGIVEHHANVTETDWVRGAYGHWGRPGVRHIVNTAAAAGLKALWWRANAGGAMMYPTNVHLASTENNPYRGYSYDKYDSFEEAVSYAHELGMKVHAWFCPFEESHSYFDGHRSRFADNHPELTSVGPEGQTLQVPDYYYEEYKLYKLSLIEEMARKWPIDGLVLDFERRGAPWRSPKYGYIDPIVKAFKAKTGRDPFKIDKNDPEWKKFRSQYFTDFIEMVKDSIARLDRKFDLILYSTDTSTSLSDVQMHDIVDDRVAFMAIMQRGASWSWAGDPVDAMKRVKDINAKKMFVMYCYNDKVPAMIEKATKAQQNDIHLCYFETTPLYRRDRYPAVATMAMANSLTLEKSFELPSHPEKAIVRAIGLCNWKLSLNDKNLLEGKYGQTVNSTFNADNFSLNNTIKIEADRIDGKPAAGFALNLKIVLKNGKTVTINTGKGWQVEKKNGESAQLLLAGKAGAPPFTPELTN